jgi:hypothetical protein
LRAGLGLPGLRLFRLGIEKHFLPNANALLLEIDVIPGQMPQLTPQSR